MPLLVPFPGTETTTRAEVGGKADALIRMAAAGLPVPPGVVLTTGFFTPWFDEITTTAPWRALRAAAPGVGSAPCRALVALAPTLPLTRTQRQTLEILPERLVAAGPDDRFAVRSSSPEEDLASASFAGGYASRLGVRVDALEDAVRDCFASSLDERVIAYKHAHGFDLAAPRLAVIVQRQIDSAVAGVGFSLNPINNDADEAVIDANWGLGESVVAGLTSPDHFVVDKVGRRVVTRTLGVKHRVVRLDAGGGTVERPGHRRDEYTLTDTQLLELTDVMTRIETLFAGPTDLEWAYAGGRLHVLQARPVTTALPLPPEMLTRPGERRILYADLALSSGLTINAPISPMGLAWMEENVASLAEVLLGSTKLDLAFEERLWFFAGGRMYQNLSNVFWLASPQTLAKGSTTSDALMAEILGGVDRARYRSARRPPWARLRMLRFAPGFLWRMRGFLGRATWAVVAPARAHRVFRQRAEAFQIEFSASLDDPRSLDELRRTHARHAMRYLVGVTMPALAAGLFALSVVGRVAGRRSPESAALAEKLTRGFTGNVVAEMGIAMFDLAGRLDAADRDDVPRLVERLERRAMPPAFLEAWDAFLATYGWRGPHEMDLASPRYADDPTLVLGPVLGMAVDDAAFDPRAAHARLVEERRGAYEALRQRAGWLRRRLLRRVHRIIELFAGTRDTPKHHNLLLYQAVRRRALADGADLVRAGRLDDAADVFDLTFDDLAAAARDPEMDLRARRVERRRFLDRLERRVRAFPPVIDSRGRILRPPSRPERPGELTGMPVSPGVVTGPVKVLHGPHEKRVEKGDVLVAYTTDPGWTPLFTNASAIVLEVGGVLQHGAVVAREYGKPCVAGIDRVLTRLHDGQIVEVDGTAGVVRIRTRAASADPTSPRP